MENASTVASLSLIGHQLSKFGLPEDRHNGSENRSTGGPEGRRICPEDFGVAVVRLIPFFSRRPPSQLKKLGQLGR